MAIQFFFEGTTIRLAKKQKLKLFLLTLFSKRQRKLTSLKFIFCTDKYLLKINKNFLGHSNLTDVITFNLSEIAAVIEAEIYISVDRVKDNAFDNGVSVEEELHRVIFHGVLHLCGFTDKTPYQKAKMTKAEDNCLKDYLQQ